MPLHAQGGGEASDAAVVVDEALVRKTAALAHLDLTDDEVSEMVHQFKDFLRFVDDMKAIDTSQLDIDVMSPRASVPYRDPLREDTVQPFDNREAIVANMPEEEDGFLRIPRVGEIED